MRLRSLLAATAAGTMLVAGSTSTVAWADLTPPTSAAGPMTAWGDPVVAPALAVPDDLTTAGIRDVAVSDRATAVVTADGRLRVWGQSGVAVVDQAPNYIIDAVSVAITDDYGVVVSREGALTGWGSGAPADAPRVRTTVTGLSLTEHTGYYVTSNKIDMWGAAPSFVVPNDPGMGDVSATPSHLLGLRQNGTVIAVGDPLIPEFNSVPDLGGRRATQIATSPGANGVVLADGSIRIWGPAVPPGQPDLAGQKVVSLDLGADIAGAVTADGVVHTWGTEAAVNAVPASLAGQPVSDITVGAKHAAVIVAYRKLTEATITGTPQVGQVFTATPATFNLTPTTIEGQWLANGHPIKDQTGTTLTVDGSLVGSSLSYRTTATRNGITWTSKSAAIGPITRIGSATALTVSPATAPAGRTRTATATVTRPGAIPTGTVTFTAGTSTSIVNLVDGKATWMLPRLASGSHPVTATYSGSPSAEPSAAVPVNLTITKVSSKVRAKARSTAKKVRIAVTVKTSRGVSPEGKVVVTLAGRRATATVDGSGRAVVALTKVKRGSYTAKVKYAGNGSVSGSKGSVKVRA